MQRVIYHQLHTHKHTLTHCHYYNLVEHVTEKLPFRLSFDEIEKRFGVGTRVYWHFLTFIIVTNALLAIVMGASFLQYLSTDRSESIGLVHCFEVSAKYFLVRDSDVDVAKGASAAAQAAACARLAAGDVARSISWSTVASTRALALASSSSRRTSSRTIATPGSPPHAIAVLLTHCFRSRSTSTSKSGLSPIARTSTTIRLRSRASRRRRFQATTATPSCSARCASLAALACTSRCC
jgi:hypothetical protein